MRASGPPAVRPAVCGAPGPGTGTLPGMSGATRSDRPAGRFRRMLDRLSSSTQELHSEELLQETEATGCTRIGDIKDREVVSVTGTLRAVTLRPRAGVPAASFCFRRLRG